MWLFDSCVARLINHIKFDWYWYGGNTSMLFWFYCCKYKQNINEMNTGKQNGTWPPQTKTMSIHSTDLWWSNSSITFNRNLLQFGANYSSRNHIKCGICSIRIRYEYEWTRFWIEIFSKWVCSQSNFARNTFQLSIMDSNRVIRFLSDCNREIHDLEGAIGN